MNPSSIWPDTKVTKAENLFFKVVAWVIVTPAVLGLLVFLIPTLLFLALISLIDWAWCEVFGIS